VTLPAQAVNGIAINASGGLTLAAGNTLVITNVQLEEGSVATPFERRPLGTELVLCWRYYEKSYDSGVQPGAATYMSAISGAKPSAGFAFSSSVRFLTSKRAAPTITVFSPEDGASGAYRDFITFANRSDFNVFDIGHNAFKFSPGAGVQTDFMFHFVANARL